MTSDVCFDISCYRSADAWTGFWAACETRFQVLISAQDSESDERWQRLVLWAPCQWSSECRATVKTVEAPSDLNEKSFKGHMFNLKPPPHLLGSELDLCDPGGVHQGAWPPHGVDDALPLRWQTHVVSRGGVERRVDAVLEVLRRRDLRPALLLPATEHRRGNAAPTTAGELWRWDLRETTTWLLIRLRHEANHTHTNTHWTHTLSGCLWSDGFSSCSGGLPESHDLLLLLPAVKHKPNKQPRWEVTCLTNQTSPQHIIIRFKVTEMLRFRQVLSGINISE